MSHAVDGMSSESNVLCFQEESRDGIWTDLKVGITFLIGKLLDSHHVVASSIH